MEQRFELIGKIIPTNEGVWTNEKEYDVLSLVTKDNSIYISKKKVHIGIDIANTDYWVFLINGGNGTVSIKMANSNELGGIIADEKTDEDIIEARIDPSTGKLYVSSNQKIDIANSTSIGGIKANTKTSNYTKEVRIDLSTGFLYVEPDKINIANSKEVGGIVADTKDETYTEEVKIDSTTGKLYAKAGNVSIANSTSIGGIKANQKTDEDTQEVKIDPNTGILYTKPGQSGGSGTMNYNDLKNKPSINNVTLDGNKSLDELGIASKQSVEEITVPIIDSSLSTTSSNPVQNKIIATEIDKINNTNTTQSNQITQIQNTVNVLSGIDTQFIGYFSSSSDLPTISSPCWALVGDLGTAKPYAYYTNAPSGFSIGWNDLSNKLGTYDFTSFDFPTFIFPTSMASTFDTEANFIKGSIRLIGYKLIISKDATFYVYIQRMSNIETKSYLFVNNSGKDIEIDMVQGNTVCIDLSVCQLYPAKTILSVGSNIKVVQYSAFNYMQIPICQRRESHVDVNPIFLWMLFNDKIAGAGQNDYAIIGSNAVAYFYNKKIIVKKDSAIFIYRNGGLPKPLYLRLNAVNEDFIYDFNNISESSTLVIDGSKVEWTNDSYEINDLKDVIKLVSGRNYNTNDIPIAHVRTGNVFICPAFQSIFTSYIINNDDIDNDIFSINKSNFLPYYSSVCRAKRGDLSSTNRWVDRCNILHISDNHSTNEDGYKNLKEAISIANMKNIKLNAIVDTGDLTNGFGIGVEKNTVITTLNKVRDIILDSNIITIPILGNHDANDYGGEPSLALTKQEQWNACFQAIHDKWSDIVFCEPNFVNKDVDVTIEQGTWGEYWGDRKAEDFETNDIKIRTNTAVSVLKNSIYEISVNEGYLVLPIFFSNFVSNEIGYRNTVGKFYDKKQSFRIYAPYDKVALIISKADNSNITPSDDYGLIFRRMENIASPSDNNYRHYSYYDISGDDFGKIRIISLDMIDHDLPIGGNGKLIYTCQNDPVYSQAQIDWLCNTALQVEDGTGIIICNHYPFDYTPTSDRNQSLIIDGKYVQPWNMIPEIINAWQNRTTLNKTYEDSVGSQNISVNVDFSNIGNNCEFITYLCGHTHFKTTKIVQGFKQMMLLEDSSGSYGTGYSWVSRLAGTTTSNAFSILSIDRTQGIIYRTSYGAYKSVNEIEQNRIEKIQYRDI